MLVPAMMVTAAAILLRGDMSLAAEVCAQNHQNFMNFNLTFKQLVTNAKTVFILSSVVVCFHTSKHYADGNHKSY